MSESSLERWNKTRLDRVIDQFIVPMRDKPPSWTGDIPWCRIEDFDGKYLHGSKSHQYVDSNIVKLMNLKVFPPGTLLCSCSATLGICTITARPLISNQTFIGLVPKREVNTEFLYYKMTSLAGVLQGMSSGTTIAYLPRTKFEALEIELPPRPQQDRIAKILSTLDETIEQTETLIAKYQQIKAGLMHDLFTRGVTLDGHLRLPRDQAPNLYKESPLGWIPKEWEIRPFRSVLVGNLQNGYFKKPELVGTGYKLVNVSELYQSFGIDTDHPNVERVAATITDIHKFAVQEGDLFFTRSSLVLSGIAQCNTVLKLKEPTLFECHVIRGIPDKNIINPAFLGLYFQIPWARRELMSRAKQTTMTTISQPDIASVPVLRPPLDEQTSIAQRITSNMMLIWAEEAYLNKLRQQKHGLMHDLLTGRVRVSTKAGIREASDAAAN